jgi:mycothiol system anti-sigma-R factor
MNCGLVRRYIDAYVDSEVDPTTQIEFERHLDVCSECQELVAFSQRMKAMVRESVSGVKAPESLRDRLRASLDEEDRRREGKAPPLAALKPLSAKYWVPLAAAAGVFVSLHYATDLDVGNPVGGPQTARMMSNMPIFEDVVRLHSTDLPADVQPARPNDVVSYFRDKVAFPVRPAAFDQSDARLVGARLSNIRDRSAAALYYNVGGRRMTVVVFDAPNLATRDVQRTRMLGKELVYQRVRGYTVPVRRQDGITYAFTGDLDRQSLLRLAASAQVH